MSKDSSKTEQPAREARARARTLDFPNPPRNVEAWKRFARRLTFRLEQWRTSSHIVTDTDSFVGAIRMIDEHVRYGQMPASIAEYCIEQLRECVAVAQRLATDPGAGKSRENVGRMGGEKPVILARGRESDEALAEALALVDRVHLRLERDELSVEELAAVVAVLAPIAGATC